MLAAQATVLHSGSVIATVTRDEAQLQTCGGVQTQWPTASAVSFEYTIDAENGTAGSVEFHVLIGQLLTGNGTTPD